jgi:hypothetical protein
MIGKIRRIAAAIPTAIPTAIAEQMRRMAYLFTRNRRRHELEGEMAFHREMAERAGRPEARRTFGNPLRLQEQAREAWGWVWLDRLIQDLRYATPRSSALPASPARP